MVRPLRRSETVLTNIKRQQCRRSKPFEFCLGYPMSRLPHFDPWVRVVVFCFLWIVIGGIRTCLPVNAQSSTFGQWSNVQTWPYRWIHTQMLPTGKVMFWDSYRKADKPQRWVPTTPSSFTPATSPATIFLYMRFVPFRWRVVRTGGHISDKWGCPTPRLQPFREPWNRVSDMSAGRWYRLIPHGQR